VTKPKISVIILNWNGKRDTLACLASLGKVTYPNFETILVDNGSTDDSVVEIKKAFPHIPILETGKNLGFAGGNNPGIERALKDGADYIFLLNNDTEVDPHILDAFVSCMENYPVADILGAKIYLFERRDQFDHIGGMWDEKRAAFELIANRAFEDGSSWEKPQSLDYACGCALFIRREVFETIGLLEPKFFLIWEEADFCMRAWRAGFCTLFCPEAKLWHKVSASFVGGRPHSTYFWWRNRLLWIERNCTPKKRLSLYLRVLIPEIVQILKIHAIKTVRHHLARPFTSPEKQLDRANRLKKSRAAIAGIRDYCLRRTDSGPAWLYSKK
jgi:GT2 family glycosyltransferase